MAPPRKMLRLKSINALRHGAYAAYLASNQAAVEENPAFLLDDIDDAVLWAFYNYPRPPPVNFGETLGVVTAVQLVITSELISQRFPGTTGTRRLQEAILAAVLDIRTWIEDSWLYDGKDVPDFAPSYYPEPTLPTEILPRVFAHLGLRDLARASRTCWDWRLAALYSTDEDLRALARRVRTDDDHIELHAIDALDGETPATLRSWRIPESMLRTRALRLIRPTQALFARAVATLPRIDRLWVRVYDANSTHFIIGTASGCVRECVGADWSFWDYIVEHDALWYRVRDVDVPNPSWSMKEVIKTCFPHAMTSATRRKFGHRVLDRGDLPAEQTLSAPQPPCRLLWPRQEKPKPAPASNTAHASDDDNFSDVSYL